MIWTIMKHEEVVIRRGGKPNGQLPSEIYLTLRQMKAEINNCFIIYSKYFEGLSNILIPK